MQLAAETRDESIDRDLERRVFNYLAARYLPALKKLEVEAHDGAVTLRGKVQSFYEKQIAIHSCQRVAGVQRLIDAVVVS
jgi:osmotically-inducible protein OsmY